MGLGKQPCAPTQTCLPCKREGPGWGHQRVGYSELTGQSGQAGKCQVPWLKKERIRKTSHVNLWPPKAQTHTDTHTQRCTQRDIIHKEKPGLRDWKSHMAVLTKNRVRIGINYIPLLSLTLACQDSRIPDTDKERTKRNWEDYADQNWGLIFVLHNRKIPANNYTLILKEFP